MFVSLPPGAGICPKQRTAALLRWGLTGNREAGSLTVAVLHMPLPARRSIAECIALLSEDSSATIDEDFARDVQASVDAHREPLNASVWD